MFSTTEEGVSWARRRRVELLEKRVAGVNEQILSDVSQLGHVFRGAQFPSKEPSSIKLSDVFDSFESVELPKLSSKTTEASRLARLREWFGGLTTEQLHETLVDAWVADRLSGKLGSGRDPNRADTHVWRSP